MPKDAEFRRLQREAYEAVLKALSVVKLDWSKQKLLAELRKHLNISQSTYVELLEKVLNDPEVKSAKGEVDVGGSLREALHEAGGVGLGEATRRPTVYESENETDTEADEDYRKDDEEDSYSEGSTSRPNRVDQNKRRGRNKGRVKKRPRMTGRRRGKEKGRPSPRDSGSRGRVEVNPLRRDEEVQYEMDRSAPVPGTGGGLDLSSLKPPYDKDVFEACLIGGTLEELREMHRQIKKRRHTLINVMLEDDDPSSYPEDDLLQKILLREKNVRQEKALEHELSLLDKQG